MLSYEEVEVNQRAIDKQLEAVPPERLGTEGAVVDGCDKPSHSSGRCGVTELELILKQMTFTRSEIDRLTALLQSRSIDLTDGDEEKRYEVLPSQAEISQNIKEVFPNAPIKNNGTENYVISTPSVNSNDTTLPDTRDPIIQKQDKAEENGPTKTNATNVKSASAINDANTTSLEKKIVTGVETTAFSVTNSIEQSLPQKKPAFRMSAHEDYLELDNDDHPIGTTSNQSQGFNPFSIGGAHTSAAGTVFSTSTESIPTQLGSSSSSPSFGSVFGSNWSAPKSTIVITGSAQTSAAGTAFATSTHSIPFQLGSSSSSPSFGSVFGSNWPAPKSPIFSTGSAQTSAAGTAFATSTHSIPIQLGSSSSSPSFGSAFGSNWQAPKSPTFGQLPMPSAFAFGPTVPSGGNQFGSPAPTGASPFQFGSQSNLTAPQNPSPFQASGSLKFNAGGSFSLGTGGSDKSTRKYVKFRKAHRKK